MTDHLYRVAYSARVLKKGATSKELPPGISLCDAFLISSIVYPEDGSFGIVFNGVDGRTNLPLSFEEIFKVWAALAYELTLHKEATSKVNLCVDVCNALLASSREEVIQ